MKIVIALGGNAILRKKDKPTIENQERNTKRALKKLYPILKNNKCVITHGNGPQAGYLMLQQADSKTPLDVIDAETEGQIGYLLQQNLKNLFISDRVERSVVTILTQVLVDRNDKAFRKPSKFIGPFYRTKKPGFKMQKDPRGGYRRVVPSPKPIKIIEKRTIKRLLAHKSVVIAAGGGGIPVVKRGRKLDGVEAVIDKDLASACLANSIGAQELMMITDVDGAYLNYKKKKQKKIGTIRLKELEKHYKAGEFPDGSMGPKIMAAINFLEKRGKRVIITNIENIERAMKGKGGTHIVK